MGANKTPQTPDFYQAMQNYGRTLRYNFYCHLPGEVITYDRTKGRADIRIGLKRVIPDYTTSTGFKLADYPQLSGVPIFFGQGGGASIGADPAPGDPCLIVVLDRNVDAWLQNGGQQAPVSDRSHDLSDCFAFVGFNNLAKPLVSARLAGEAGIADAVAKVVVKAGLIDISNGPLPANNLGGILTTLFTALAADPGLSGASHTALAAANASLATLLY